MKKFAIIALLLVSTALSVAAQADIAVKSGGLGRLAVTKGKKRVTIDVSKNVSGCLYATAAIKKRVKDCAAPPVTFELVDAQSKGGFEYLLVATDAAGNCNVCGRCGASSAFGLIWLKLDSNLALIEKQSTPLEFCLLDITLLSKAIEFDEAKQLEKLKLRFDEKDMLILEFEQRVTPEEAIDAGRYQYTRLEYNRREPEKGWKMIAEMRSNSSVEN